MCALIYDLVWSLQLLSSWTEQSLAQGERGFLATGGGGGQSRAAALRVRALRWLGGELSAWQWPHLYLICLGAALRPACCWGAILASSRL